MKSINALQRIFLCKKKELSFLIKIVFCFLSLVRIDTCVHAQSDLVPLLSVNKTNPDEQSDFFTIKKKTDGPDGAINETLPSNISFSSVHLNYPHGTSYNPETGILDNVNLPNGTTYILKIVATKLSYSLPLHLILELLEPG